MEENKTRGSFTDRIGFVLAAAGSAVGLGNLWRFPYLAAKDGGGIFLLIYIILALTFGFALMTTEIALGRKTGRSPIGAFKIASKKFTWLGYLALIVPFLIFPYYSVIGGWVCKYASMYITGRGMTTADASGNFFMHAIGATGGPISIETIIWFIVFIGLTAVVVYLGVDKGIEKCSKILMPVLVIIIVAISIYSLTLSDPTSGRTALQGLKIYVTPDFRGMTLGKILKIALDAMGQLFYSMSLAMGIMITYGSYARKDSNLVSSVNQIEFFDTLVALLAGLIMVPAVYCFLGNEGLTKAGPSLMFIALPQVFSKMGFAGNIVGSLFFLLVIFAAITSSISLMEAIVSMLMDRFKMKRNGAATFVLISSIILGVITCLGYNKLFFNVTLPNGASGQILDIVDWLTNNFLMPIVAIFTCIVIGWFTGTKYITDEVSLNGERFGRKKLYIVMVKYIAPIFLLAIFLSGFGLFQ